MRIETLTCAAFVLLMAGCKQEADVNYGEILNFEASTTAGELIGWGSKERVANGLHLDLEVVHSGTAAGRMEAAKGGDSNGANFTLSIPVDFSGEALEFRGWLKTEDVVGGFAGLWLREDGVQKRSLEFDNMRDSALSGTTEWTEYSITLPLHPEASRIVLGALLVGTGKVWVDDLELLVDGQPLAEAPQVVGPEEFKYPIALGGCALLILFTCLFARSARKRLAKQAPVALDRASGTAQRVILFDGVCNLCHSAVRWVIERDRKGKFDFASLQSDAAKALLSQRLNPEQIAALPDSIVLVDSKGVHTRSAAAVRIAVALGIPYALLGIGWLLPRPIRDMVYRWIARHRYRWFGRQDSCLMPSPELSARFLDAEEPREPIAVSDTGPATSRSWLRAYASRFVILYVLLYLTPFPFTTLARIAPDLWGIQAFMYWAIGLWGDLLDPIIEWAGEAVFDVKAVDAPSGSGDTTYDYVALAVNAGLALILALPWTALARARRVAPATLEFSRLMARYYLATYMLVYGYVKLFPLQFSTPSPSRLMQPIGDTSPMGLAWTFLGASVAYQMFAGLAELAGGYLLLFRRTRLIGSLVSVAVMINVMAINFCFDVPVKLFSSNLVLMALFVMAADLPRLIGLFGFRLPIRSIQEKPFWTASRGMALSVAVVHLVLVGLLTKSHIESGIESSKIRGPFVERDPLEGIYKIESFVRDGLADRENEDAARWVQVGFRPPHVIGIRLANGNYSRTFVELAFTEHEDGVIRLEGLVEGKPTVIRMRLKAEKPRLTSRGYHWINEFPFNR